MRVLAAENISKRYGERALLSDVTLQINQGDKIGLIGVNGTGKSTLLRLLAGEELPDGGSVFCQPGQRVAYLPQNPAFAPEDTVLEHVLRYAGRDVQRESYRAKVILTKLGVTDFGEKTGHLSGGQRKRLAMAAALVQPSEILILDEPTNHLDYEMVEWLEGQLKSYKGSLVMVTHDRYFLDRVCNCIAEIDHGKLYRYQANYEGFLQLKSEREESARASERKRQSLLKRELAWLQRGARARGTKSRERIQRIEALKNQSGPAREKMLAVESLKTRLGRKTLEARHIAKAYGDRVLIGDFSYIVLPRDRIGIVGKNGSGKSTLVKLLCGLVPPDSGEVIRGETVKIGYFSQESEELDPHKRVIDIVRDIAEDVHTKQGVITASQMLERFLFPAGGKPKRRGKAAAVAAVRADGQPKSFVFGRAHQRFGHSDLAGAGGVFGKFCRRRHCRFARQVFSGPCDGKGLCADGRWKYPALFGRLFRLFGGAAAGRGAETRRSAGKACAAERKGKDKIQLP